MDKLSRELNFGVLTEDEVNFIKDCLIDVMRVAKEVTSGMKHAAHRDQTLYKEAKANIARRLALMDAGRSFKEVARKEKQGEGFF